MKNLFKSKALKNDTKAHLLHNIRAIDQTPEYVVRVALKSMEDHSLYNFKSKINTAAEFQNFIASTEDLHNSVSLFNS